MNFEKIKPLNSKELNFIFVGCWGTYCKDENEKQTVIDVKKGEIKIKKVTYGEKNVVDAMKKYTSTMTEYDDGKKIDAVILAGDNVYKKPVEYLDIRTQELKEKLEKLEKLGVDDMDPEIVELVIDYDQYGENLLESKLNILSQKTPQEKLKEDIKKENYNIRDQLQEGFAECITRVPAKIFLIGIGNHDIENCDILKYQKNYSNIEKNNLWYLPNEYYVVQYDLESFKVKFIFIDTNIYEDKIKCDYDLDSFRDKDISKYTEYKQLLQDQQATWLADALAKSDSNTWNIVIGHTPFYFIPHKSTLGFRPALATLISNNYSKIDLYMCADEHNQQYIPGNNIDLLKRPPQIIVGSGGAPLDTPSSLKEEDIGEQARDIIGEGAWVLERFGFAAVDITSELINITYYGTDISKDPRKVEIKQKNKTI